MFYREYENFDDLFYNFNREILLNPNELINHCNGLEGILENVMLKSKTTNCNLDLSDFGFKKEKWPHLIRTYMNKENWYNFLENLSKSTSLSMTYYFNTSKTKTSSKSNSNMCLIAMTITRSNRNKPFDKINVFYRTSEIQRKLAADLVLINRMINELPKNCEIDSVYFVFAQCYINALLINGYMDYFDVNIDDLDDSNKWVETCKRRYEGYFKTKEIAKERNCKFSSVRKMQNFYFKEGEWPSININELSIKDYFEKEN